MLQDDKKSTLVLLYVRLSQEIGKLSKFKSSINVQFGKDIKLKQTLESLELILSHSKKGNPDSKIMNPLEGIAIKIQRFC